MLITNSEYVLSYHMLIYVTVYILQLFAANQNKPPDIVSILVANRSKLLRLFADLKTDKGIKVPSLCQHHALMCLDVFYILCMFCCRG